MEVPSNILSIISRINQSENNWKAIFMAIWQHSEKIKSHFQNTGEWNKKISFQLPLSKNNVEHYYTPYQLYSILTSRDGEFTIGHLLTLFSLFEDLLNQSSKILCSSELTTSKWENMKNFFKEDKTKDILFINEINELNLAKKTRNCYIHTGGKIDSEWIKAYKEVKGDPIVSIGDELNKGFPNIFHQIEEWNELIMKISSRIKTKIENL